MALTQAFLDKLVQAWATGARRVEYSGTVTEFTSGADLERRIAVTANALGVPNPLSAAAPAARAPSILLQFRR
ncbi:phage head-tail joining protein [Azospirillum canadense]|uniref:phage head-tail joining protein n=1 Tax=Azospirillum canadense TaxID=403962 RepID=UPI0022271FFE|nr:hypothetical protein [Azospirillum canadense]MCW2242245.1 hypothetical protein [Azospirillum canadense]